MYVMSKHALMLRQQLLMTSGGADSDTLLVLCNRQSFLAGKAVKDPAKQQWPGACLLLHAPAFVQLCIEK